MQHKKSLIKNIADFLNPYGWIVKARNRAFDRGCFKSHSFDIPVICIGNISVGGTGKTPHTEYLIKLLRERERVAVLSRGYGRKSKGFIKADDNTPMSLIGDEPYQIKCKFPEITVAVCEKRVIGTQRLLDTNNSPSVILLDDAYQHRYIKAGLYILLIDINRPIWNDCLLPFGRLRESDKAAKRADIIIITKCNENISQEIAEYCKANLKTKENTPVFFSKVRYGIHYSIFDNKKNTPIIREGVNVLLLTGIAKPEPLKKEIEKRGAKVTLMQYADHYNFTEGDIHNISKTFDKIEGEKIIITTEKDATRLRGIATLPQNIKENIYALPIEIEILDDQQETFNQIILDYVTENTRNS